jgi:hypothetical protein
MYNTINPHSKSQKKMESNADELTMKELNRLESEYNMTRCDCDGYEVFSAVAKIADGQIAAINANLSKYKSVYMESRLGDDEAFKALLKMSKKMA